MKKNIILGSLLTIFLLIVLYLLNFPSLYYELKGLVSNPEEVKEYIQGFGIWGPIIIILIQIIQVIISPIPGNVTALAAGAIYGVIKGFLLNTTGIIIGAVSAFYLARLFGKPLVIKIIGKNAYKKYSKMISEKYSIGLLILFFLPFFPDDALCLLAGISNMPVSTFLFFVVVGRAPGMFVATLVGSGTITLSLPLWIAFGIVSIIMIYFSIKYNKKIEAFVHEKVQKQKKRFHR